jgi:alkaline phosphatase
MVRFGMSADAHLMGADGFLGERDFTQHLQYFAEYRRRIRTWRADFLIDLGDLACQADNRPICAENHSQQLAGLRKHSADINALHESVYHVMGNHDVGWIEGGDEDISPTELIHAVAPQGEDVTKAEFVEHCGVPDRYYSFDHGHVHFIVLDSCNRPPPAAAAGGAKYWVDDSQLDWLATDLDQHAELLTVAFVHTPVQTESYPGEEHRCVGNGAEVRRLFARHGKVLACFNGHVHVNDHVVLDGTHYIALAGMFCGGGFSRVTIAADLQIDGFANQDSYRIAIPE